MEQVLAAKRALATAEVITQAAALMHPSAQRALDLATHKVLDVNSDDGALAALAKRADAVTEFDPLSGRIGQLEKMVGELSRKLDSSIDTSDLLGRANKLIGTQP